MLRTHQIFAALLLLVPLACSATSDVPTGNTGAAGTTVGSAGTPSAGGTAGAAGSSSAGSSSMAGTGGIAGAPNGGASTAGTTNGGASAGMSLGGNGGAAAGAAGSSGGPNESVKPSAGCGKAGRPPNGKVTVANEEIIDFPESYDGAKPMPLLLALHACGNPNTQWEGLLKGSAFEAEYVRLMPNTTDGGQCWTSYNNNIARILAQYDNVLATYCVDTNRIFGVGHSSGAQMLVNILSHKSDAEHLNFRGVSPVAADPFNVAVPMPVLYIDGQMDNQRSPDSAKNAVAKFRAANMCADTSTPYTAIMGCQSGNVQVNPGCIRYDSCVVPTIWCSHDDPNYGGTEHGVPCFGIKAMYDFFKTL